MSGEKPWRVTELEGHEVHVVPEAGTDHVQHQLDDECICGPTCEPVPRQDGSMGWVYTHHSLDGREAHE